MDGARGPLHVVQYVLLGCAENWEWSEVVVGEDSAVHRFLDCASLPLCQGVEGVVFPLPVQGTLGGRLADVLIRGQAQYGRVGDDGVLLDGSEFRKELLRLTDRLGWHLHWQCPVQTVTLSQYLPARIGWPRPGSGAISDAGGTAALSEWGSG